MTRNRLASAAGIYPKFLTLIAFGALFVGSAFGDIGTGLMARFKMDEGTGSTTKDSVSSRTCTLRNGPTWITSGKYNNGLQFDTINDNGFVNDFSYHSGIGKFSLSFWFQFKSGALSSSLTTRALFGHGSVTARKSLCIYLAKDTLRTSLYDTLCLPGQKTLDITGMAGYENDQWHLYTLTADSANVKVYLDGVSKKTTTSYLTGSKNRYDPADSILIAKYKNGSTNYMMGGKLDELRLYNRALTATDVTELFNYIPNTAPVAQNVQITGTLNVGQQLTGSYTYHDGENDPESGTTFQWYRADDATGTNRAAIAGATSAQYTLVDADESKWVQFEVTPHAQTGVINGAATPTSFQGPVLSNAGIAYAFPKVCGDNQNMKVNGQIRCNSILVHNWLLSQKGAPTLPPDYVFDKGYSLASLKETERYIDQTGHLPQMPSAEEFNKDGVDMVKLNFLLLQKVEEMTLYMIAQEKKIEGQGKEIEELKGRVEGTEAQRQKEGTK